MVAIMAVGNQKGGVGKTTVTLGLAGAFAQAGRSVLVIDLDPQGNATNVLAGEEEPSFNAYDVLMSGQRGTIGDAVMPSCWAGVDVVHSHRELATFERQNIMAPDTRLSMALEGAGIKHDVVLIDMPPSLGRLVVNGLGAADATLVVTQAEAFSVDGLGAYLSTVDQVRSMLNPRLEIAGVVVNQVTGRRLEHAVRLEEVREALGERVLEPPVPSRAAANEMVSSRTPLHEIRGSAGARTLAEVFGMYVTKLGVE